VRRSWRTGVVTSTACARVQFFDRPGRREAAISRLSHSFHRCLPSFRRYFLLGLAALPGFRGAFHLNGSVLKRLENRRNVVARSSQNHRFRRRSFGKSPSLCTGPNAFLSSGCWGLLFGVPKHAPINCACVRRGACRLLQLDYAGTGASCKHGHRCELDPSSTTAVSAQF
jgi:hypothetical protein